ncbi:glycosyltransferase family 4 protein [Acinetobacter modestus]|jgi:glycosyltransferase involved in cell wall biosynthesis|uniref:glycosyltransferase family 4 protein n=1 Tax=Acinetobacter modestus TaxID=1776740 RepID=UPI001F4B4E99|nr:glycosyltransferase family 4 protein [Acinetobacter modestus]MCH7388473.1 glycosyltransferase family 4 protein [Acinetobacter modestus]
MNITLVISSLGIGGAERALAGLANWWCQKHNVTIITYLDTPDFYPLDSKIFRIKIKSEKASIKAINFIKRCNNLRQEIYRSSPDVVLSFVDRCNVLTLISTFGLGIKVIVAERTNPQFYNIGKVWSILRNFTYPRAHKIIIQTESIKKWALKYKKENEIYIIPNAIDKYRLSLIKSETETEGEVLKWKNSILAMGRLSFEKGHDQLLRSFSIISENYPDWGIEIIGDGILKDSLINLAKELGIENKLYFHGNRQNPFPIMKQAEIFVLPSRIEGFPNVLLEALCTGMACISFNCPSGPSDLIKNDENGLLVEAENLNALASAIEYMILNPDLRKRFSSEAIKTIDYFNETEIMKLWDEALCI